VIRVHHEADGSARVVAAREAEKAGQAGGEQAVPVKLPNVYAVYALAELPPLFTLPSAAAVSTHFARISV
jgi:hypothetical protein